METTSEVYDPLGLKGPINDVDTLRPVVLTNNYLAIVKECKVGPNKAQTGNNLEVTFALVADAPSVNPDKPVKAGFTFKKWMPLQQSEKENAPDFMVEPMKLLDAACGTKQGTRPEISSWNQYPEHVLGKELVIRVALGKNDQTGEPNNEVKGYAVKPAEVTA